MSVHKSTTQLVSLAPNQVSKWLETLLDYKYVEILDPRSLGSQWAEVELLSVDHSKTNPDISKLEFLLKSVEAKGFFNTFVDQSIATSQEDMQHAQEESSSILNLAQDFWVYKHLHQAQEKVHKLSKSNKNRTVFIGKDLYNFKDFLDDFSKSTIREFQQNHPNQELILENPEMSVEMLALDWEVAIVDSKDENFVFNAYKKYEENQEKDVFKLHTLESFEHWLKTEITRYNLLLKNKGLDPVKPSHQSLKRVTALKNHLLRLAKVENARQYLFKTEPSGVAIFAMVAVPPKLKQGFLELNRLNEIPTQEVHWNQEIVMWEQGKSWQGFQKVAQSLGTIDTKEADPTKAIGFFFSLFFAFCLGDALYGLFLTIFCGYFIYFKKLKPQFENIFNLFFYSGIATVIYGAITNSWAGDLFNYTSAKGFFESLQIINTLDPNANVPVNILLRENGGLSPIVVMLGLSILIGLTNIISAYILGLKTAYRSADWVAFKAQLSWFIFILSLLGLYVLPAISSTLSMLSIVIAITSFIMLFIFNQGKSLVSKIVGGLGSIYGLIGFFADTLSFTRLIAVGLTGGIIANVINLLAVLVFNSIPVPGLNYIVTALILVGGHLFNFAVSLFGAYVNPLRLHYVEFMPKFYEGRARELKPLN